MNRIEIPVLVLSSVQKRVKKSVAERLSVSIDSGPSFRPTHVRREGEDPISLSILIDTGSAQRELLPALSASIADLAPSSLNVRDRVSVYGLGCDLVRTLTDAPANRAQLQSASERAMYDSGGKRRSAKEPCKQEVHFWDALGFVTHDLASRPGRRVILVISNGHDEGSRVKWNELRNYAQSSGVTLFGLHHTVDLAEAAHTTLPPVENLFAHLCELTGGTVLQASTFDVGEQLRWFTAMVRERYIVEFPRPWNAAAGQHALVVSIGTGDYFVRSAGTIVPVINPREVDYPATLPSDPLLTPTLGPRHPLSPPR